jgi:CRISPR-associated protein Csx16
MGHSLQIANQTKTWFVGRHEGSMKWVKSEGFDVDHFIAHLDFTEGPQAGDTVIGTLPIHIVAKLNKMGVRFLHLHLALKASQRGKELTCEDVESASPELIEYLVLKLNVPT